MNLDIMLIEGLCVGLEHYYDEELNFDYYIVSLLIFQFIFFKERE